MDIRTDYERAKQERDVRLCAMYRELRERYPDCSNNRLARTIAEDQKMTVNGVRKILVRNNLIVKGDQPNQYSSRQRQSVAPE